MKNRILVRWISGLMLVGLVGQTVAQAQKTSFPVKRQETPKTWERDGLAAVQRARKMKFKRRKAKNVILFIGDGMSISTLAAARILEGQLRGESGEENSLSFEQFPSVALSKTYTANQQTSDSAPTAAAILTGQKTNEGLISVNQNVKRGDHIAALKNKSKTLLELAEENGKSTGVVSTARLTHATPAACYAHSPDRNWEVDSYVKRLSEDAYKADYPDIARQLIEFPYGNGLEVALGGGRRNFLPDGMKDPEHPERRSATGMRLDKRNLTEEWTRKYRNAKYVWNKQQFDAVDARKTDHLLGLFQYSHMQYEFDRPKDKAGEPSLTQMTEKAIDILSKNKKGFFLVVEAGRIDHAHHDGNAFRALTDTIELSNAVRKAKSKVNLKNTMIVVTADHSHTMTFAGYPARGNNILGLVREVALDGGIKKETAKDIDKKPYTTLGYANGTGYVKGERPELTDEKVIAPNYKQEATVPKTSETHGGEDVAIFADGTSSWMFHGVMEQNWIFYVMRDAMRMRKGKR